MVFAAQRPLLFGKKRVLSGFRTFHSYNAYILYLILSHTNSSTKIVENEKAELFRSAHCTASILTLFVRLVPLGSGSASTPTPLGFTASYSLRSFRRASLGNEKAKLFRFAHSLRL